MLVNCVAYQEGRKLADIPKEHISECVERRIPARDLLDGCDRSGTVPLVQEDTLAVVTR